MTLSFQMAHEVLWDISDEIRLRDSDGVPEANARQAANGARTRDAMLLTMDAYPDRGGKERLPLPRSPGSDRAERGPAAWQRPGDFQAQTIVR